MPRGRGRAGAGGFASGPRHIHCRRPTDLIFGFPWWDGFAAARDKSSAHAPLDSRMGRMRVLTDVLGRVENNLDACCHCDRCILQGMGCLFSPGVVKYTAR